MNDLNNKINDSFEQKQKDLYEKINNFNFEEEIKNNSITNHEYLNDDDNFKDINYNYFKEEASKLKNKENEDDKQIIFNLKQEILDIENKYTDIKIRFEANINDFELIKNDLDIKNNYIKEIENKGIKTNEETNKYLNQINQFNEKILLLKNKNKDLQSSIALKDKDLSQNKKELNECTREINLLNKDLDSRSKKLNKAYEDIDKLKNEIKIIKSYNNKDNKVDINNKLYEENKKLEKQRNELYIALKKQMKLIEILKKQKIHLQASQMLKFTEDEFINILDIGKKIN